MLSSFQSIQMQLAGPVPADLYHRYVEFKPFVQGMFQSKSLRGRLLNRALHHQHARVYNFDKSTKYGVFQEPCTDLTKKFLDFVHYDQGGRIFTYVLTLDAQFRFTETGKEFGIDLLSKHTMHSDVSIYIAFSGEFFIRKLKHPQAHRENSGPDPLKHALPPSADPGAEAEAEEKAKDNDEEKSERKEKNSDKSYQNRPGPTVPGKSSSSQSIPIQSSTASPRSPSSQPSTDPSHYELIIDNDSGTYRPNAEKLGMLREYLMHALPGLKVHTLDCQGDEAKMKKLKDEQRQRKKEAGKQITYMQNSSLSSISSSDEDELDARARGEDGHEHRYKREMHKYMGHGKDDFHYDPKTDGPGGVDGSGSANAVNHELGEKDAHAPINEPPQLSKPDEDDSIKPR